MKRVFIMTIALMFLFCIPLLSFAAGKPQPPSSGAFIPPAWSQKLPAAERFALVLDGAAVLDKETGLVWERSPDNAYRIWIDAINQCYSKQVGGRLGWRLPTVEELASLVDLTQSNPALPSGHPFDTDCTSGGCVQSYIYWSATTLAGAPSGVWGVNMDSGYVGYYDKTGYGVFVWCVRGGQGYDAY